MEEKQAEFLRALIDCGTSFETLSAVGMIIKTEAHKNADHAVISVLKYRLLKNHSIALTHILNGSVQRYNEYNRMSR